MSVSEFKEKFFKQEIHQEIENLSIKFYEILSEIDIYDLSEELKNEIDELNLIDILNDQISREDEIIKDIGKGLYVFKEVL